MRRDVVKMLGGRDLRGVFARKIHAVFLDELNKAVKLRGSKEGIDGIGEKDRIRA